MDRTSVGSEDWVAKVRSTRQFSDGDRRAPYKPLLLLWAIGRLAAGHPARVSFCDAEEELTRLMEGHRLGETLRVSYPFVYLGTNRDLWRVEAADGSDIAAMPQRVRESRPFLLGEATGELAPDFVVALENPRVRSRVVNTLLDMEFPESLHAELLEEVGLGHLVAPRPPQRDPRFRRIVLLAYEHRCAFCGFDGILRNSPVAIDAAHVQMRSHRGPDHITNGVALCTFHHRLFDQGALGLDSDRRILVSQHMIVRAREANNALMRLAGMPMLEPQRGYEPPAIPHVKWHYRNLFVRPARRPSSPGSPGLMPGRHPIDQTPEAPAPSMRVSGRRRT